MSSLITSLRDWLAPETVIYECRNCGTTLGADETACPHCGSEEVVEYDIDER